MTTLPAIIQPQLMLRPGHPLIVRINHWINAAAIFIMIPSGFQIYNAYPIFPFQFPTWATLGGWLGGALLWHLAAIWLLSVNYALQVGYGVASGRFCRKLFPLSPLKVLADLRAALAGRLGHGDLTHYNALQKLFYLGALGLTAAIILSGFAIWKPVQLSWLTALFGGFETARVVHFLAMAGIAGFLLVHVVMVALVPKTLRAMIFGR